MRRSGTGYIRIPLLDADPENYDLRDMGERLEMELESLVSGQAALELANENLPRYSFNDSTKERNPDWWRPQVRMSLEVDDPTVEAWFNEVEQSLAGGENYSLTRETGVDSLTGENPEVTVSIGDYEQKNGGIRVETPDERRLFNTVSDARHHLENNVPERSFEQGIPSYAAEGRKIDEITIESDLSAGFFQTSFRLGDGEHSSEVWMPYADREKALLVGAPSQFNTEANSEVVPVQGETYTGDSMIDAVSESLSYFLPFEGIQQPETTPEAIDFRNDNPVGNTPYTVQISPEAWEKLEDLDTEYSERVRNKVDQIAMNPGRTPLEMREEGKFDQIGSEDLYVTWTEDEQTETVKLTKVQERKEAFKNRGSGETRT